MGTRLTRWKTDGAEVLVVGLVGDIDISNSFHVVEAILADAVNTTRGVVLDLSATGYMDSSGVHVLLDVRRRLANRRQELRLVVPEDGFLNELLELTAVPAIARVHRTVDDALRSLLGEASPKASS